MPSPRLWKSLTFSPFTCSTARITALNVGRAFAALPTRRSALPETMCQVQRCGTFFRRPNAQCHVFRPDPYFP